MLLFLLLLTDFYNVSDINLSTVGIVLTNVVSVFAVASIYVLFPELPAVASALATIATATVIVFPKLHPIASATVATVAAAAIVTVFPKLHHIVSAIFPIASTIAAADAYCCSCCCY